jgi:hypothetical protein
MPNTRGHANIGSVTDVKVRPRSRSTCENGQTFLFAQSAQLQVPWAQAQLVEPLPHDLGDAGSGMLDGRNDLASLTSKTGRKSRPLDVSWGWFEVTGKD